MDMQYLETKWWRWNCIDENNQVEQARLAIKIVWCWLMSLHTNASMEIGFDNNIYNTTYIERCELTDGMRSWWGLEGNALYIDIN